jgi:hypothetical protein
MRVVKCDLRELCFLEVLGDEMVGFRVKILAKSDGGIVIFWYGFQCWQLAAGKGRA